MPEQTLLDRARQEYPVLRDYDLQFKRSPRADAGYLEYWPVGEPGSKDRPRPPEFEIGKPGLEVYRDDVRPIDILGDVVSHQLVNTDPRVREYYGKFRKSLSDNQRMMLRSQYDHARSEEGERRPYLEWEERSGLPAYFRGYAFDQWPREQAGEFYTPDQIKMFDEMMGYLSRERQ